MAPLCADPRQLVIALNPARRKALFKLIHDITNCMTSQLEAHSDALGSIVPEDEGTSTDGTSGPEGKSGGSPSRDGRVAGSPPKRAKRSKEAEQVQRAALQYTFEWRDEILSKLEEIVTLDDTDKIIAERRARREKLERKAQEMQGIEPLTDVGGMLIDRTEDLLMLQSFYHPLPTRLTTIPVEDREEALSCVLLLLLSTGKYSAHSRTLVLYLSSCLEIPQTWLNKEETEIAKSLMESSTANIGQNDSMSADAEAAKRRQENKVSRYWKVGLASVAGAAVIGVTGGLAAPLVAGALGSVLGGVGLGGVASFLGVFWMNGALVGTLFGAYGAKMTGKMMDSYAKEVEDFRFLPLEGELDTEIPEHISNEQKEQRRLRVTIGINGWLNSEEDIKKPWRVLSSDTEVFALRYEMKTLLGLGTAFNDLIQSFAWKAFKTEVIKRTVLATLWAALWPIQVLAMASNVDNPFNRASNRSRKAGQLLADALINKVQGERPVTLVGYSLGATTIHACLQSLAERHAFGLVDTVILIGTPAPSDAAHWRTIRPAVSGNIFNVYSENDMVLGFVYRMHSLALGVAGLQGIKEVDGIENLDLSERVSGHLRYASLTGEILRQCGFLSVKASSEIEKDDVIRMKEQHAAGGALIDFEDAPPAYSETVNTTADDLRGLTVSPPALAAPISPLNGPAKPTIARRPVPQSLEKEKEPEKEPENPPPLPRRSTQAVHAQDEDEAGEETGHALARRSTAPIQGENDAMTIPRRPVTAIKDIPARPQTPQYDSDDGEYLSITMVDLDEEEDHRI